MSTASVLFDLPEQIRQGLATGVLTRFGGTIRETATGRIVCFLKEIDLTNKIEELTNSIDELGAHLVGVERMQVLTMGGLAGVAMICVAGFVYVGGRLAKVEKQLTVMQKSLDEIKDIVKLIHASNIVSLAKEYYRAYAAYQENDYEEALKHARNCSSDIENYFENMPVEKILVDEKSCSFLIHILSSSMQCHLAAAYLVRRENIPRILKWYRMLFAKLAMMIKNCMNHIFTSIPTAELFQIYRLKKDSKSYLCKLSNAIPVALEILDDESLFLGVCPHVGREALEQKSREGASYLVVMNAEGERENNIRRITSD